jgi:hypothetical protein
MAGSRKAVPPLSLSDPPGRSSGIRTSKLSDLPASPWLV